MESKELLDKALKLPPDEKIAMVDGLLHSLDEPDAELDAIWNEEAEVRLRAYRAGKLKGIVLSEIFKDGT